MFKIPDWEEDIPKSNLSFSKSSNKKPKLPTTTPQAKSLNNKTKSPVPKEKKTKNNQNITKKDDKSRKRKVNGEFKTKKKEPETLGNIDTDKLDEVILNAKKKKFNEALERDDVEDVLFKEDSETSNIKTAEESDKKLQQRNNTANRNPRNIKTDNKKPFNPNNEKESIENGEIFMSHNNKKAKKKDKSMKITKTSTDLKKERLKQVLKNNRNSISVTGNKLRERMLERLKAAQFRYLNEKLYTSSGSEAKELFTSDPTAFQTYHEGYQQQVKKWPIKPLDVIAKRIRKMPKTYTIADMGCGEAALSRLVPHPVRSFDLVSTAPGVEVCDISHTPLLAASVDVAVYCLALMGTDLTQFLLEANRVLKTGGHLLIAEVESRFDKVEDFTKSVEKLGFKLKKLDKNNDMFVFMEFVKIREAPVKKSKLPIMTLKPCLYKKR